MLDRCADALKQYFAQAAEPDYAGRCVSAPGGHGVLFQADRHLLCNRYLGAFPLKLRAFVVLRLVGNARGAWLRKEFKLVSAMLIETADITVDKVLLQDLVPSAACWRCVLLTLLKITEGMHGAKVHYARAEALCAEEPDGALEEVAERLGRVAARHEQMVELSDRVLMADLQFELAAAHRQRGQLPKAAAAYEASIADYRVVGQCAGQAPVAAAPHARLAAAMAGLAHTKVQMGDHAAAKALFEAAVGALDDAVAQVECAQAGFASDAAALNAIERTLWATDHRQCMFPARDRPNLQIRWLSQAGAALELAFKQVERELGIDVGLTSPKVRVEGVAVRFTFLADAGPPEPKRFRKLASMLVGLAHALGRAGGHKQAKELCWSMAFRAIRAANNDQDRPLLAAILLRIPPHELRSDEINGVLNEVIDWATNTLKNLIDSATAHHEIADRHASARTSIPWRQPPGSRVPIDSALDPLWVQVNKALAEGDRRSWLAGSYFLHVLHGLLWIVPSAGAAGTFYSALGKWLQAASATRSNVDARCAMGCTRAGADVTPTTAAQLVVPGLQALRAFRAELGGKGAPLGWQQIDQSNRDCPEHFWQFRYGPVPRLEWVLQCLTDPRARAAVEGAHLLAAMVADTLVDWLRLYQPSNRCFVPGTYKHLFGMMRFGRERMHLADEDAPRRHPREMLRRLFEQLAELGDGPQHRGTLRHEAGKAIAASGVRQPEYVGNHCGLCHWEVPRVGN